MAQTLSHWQKCRLFFAGLCNPYLTVPRICQFSALFWEMHDYPEVKGGDGIPAHFYTYTCWHCGREFTL